MNTPVKIFFVLAAALLVTTLLAFTPTKGQATVCVEWHVVHQGESLDTISRDYGISRAELVALNKLSNPRRVFPGQRLCVDTGGNTSSSYHSPSDCDCYDWYDDNCKTHHEYDCDCKDADKHGYHQGYHHYYNSDDEIRDWNFSVVRVREDRDATIQANSFPHDSTFQVEMRYDGGAWVYSDQLNSSGSFKATVPIPHQLRGYSPLIIRVTKYPDAITDLETFANYSYTESSRCAKPFAKFEYQYKHKYEGIPTIRIENVLRGKSVTIQTNNFPPHLEFNVYMGEIGRKGKGGYYAGDFYSGTGGTFFVTIDIPSQLKGEVKIAIRTESTEKGYYSYNWFNNKTAH